MFKKNRFLSFNKKLTLAKNEKQFSNNSSPCQGEVPRRGGGVLLIITLLISSLFAGLPTPTKAASASLYLTPSSGTYVIGGTFSVGVKVNTGGDPVNAAEGSISYNTDVLSVASISKGGSIFNLWTVDPKDSGGSISFGGGIPHPGYTGTAGTIFTVTFKSKKAGTGNVRFTSGAVLANDGKGTNILASMGSGNYTIAPRSEAPVNPTTPKPEAPKPVVERIKPVIVSLTHPDQGTWYKNKNVSFKWDLPSGVSGVSLLLNDSPTSDPGPKSDGEQTDIEFTDLEDGVWYFHLKFRDSKGWGTIAHYRLQIDNSPPLPFAIESEQEDGNWPILIFETKDELSGVEIYEVKIGSLDHTAYDIEPEVRMIQATDLAPGKHSAIVKAIDAAGNETFSEGEFYVKALAAPEITSYLSEIRPKDKLFISGTAIKEGKVTVVVSSDKAKRQIETMSDKEGNWFIAEDADLPNGRFYAFAEAENVNGLKSEKSPTISFMVTPPVFTRIGDFVVNYFTVFVSLLFLILLIILISVLLAILFKKKVKKETLEVEDVLRKNLAMLKQNIDTDLGNLENIKTAKAIKEESHRIKNDLDSKIEDAKKKILKEIEDVEKIVK